MNFGRALAAVGILVLVGGGIWFFVGNDGTEEEFPWGLHIVVFDVGQADAIAIVSPEGDVVIIDAGHGSTAAGKITDFLGNEIENGVGDIDQVMLGVVTHYDRDHVGGFAAIDTNEVVFQTVIDQGPSQRRSGAPIYQGYLDWVGDPNDNMVQDPSETRFVRQRATVGQEFQLGAARIRVIGVRGDTEGTAHDLDLDPIAADIDENPGSIALLVTLGEFEFYTAGDQTSNDWKTSEPDTEIGIVNADALGVEDDIDVFKVSHHGSDTSNGEEFIRALDPEVAIISTRFGGDRLPKRIVVKTLIDNGALVYITGNGLENTNFADSGPVSSDDNWIPPADSFINAAGDVHVLVSTDGLRYRVLAGDDWREFSAVDSDNVH